MVIDVSQLIKEPIGTTWRCGFKETIGDSPVSTEATLIRTDKGILVSGKVQAAHSGICSRCLMPIEQELGNSFDEEYQFQPVEGEFTISSDLTINISEAVRQYTLLAIPMKPLCREDCAGLCPTCGHDLNMGACECAATSVDPRLAKLAMLRSDREG